MLDLINNPQLMQMYQKGVLHLWQLLLKYKHRYYYFLY